MNNNTINKSIYFIKNKLPMARLFVGSTGVLLVGTISQALGFVVLAHYLGTVQFGRLMVITSVAAVASTWCGFCPGEMLRRRFSREPSMFSAALGHGLITIFVTGAFLTIVSIAGMMLFIPAEFDPLAYLKILVLLVPTNIVLSSYLNLTEQIFLAHGDVLRANFVNCGFGVARAVTPIVACVFFGVSDLRNWAVWHAGLYAVVCLVHATATWRYGTPRWVPRWGLLRNELTLGINLSLSGFLIAFRSNVDVLVLQAVATPHLVGVYGVARRVVSTAFIVPGSFDRLIYGKLAKVGKGGPLATLHLARRYLVYSIGISATTSASLFVIAPYVPWLFGSDFDEASTFVRILCWSVISTAIQFLAFDSLNAADQHKFSTIISGSTNVAGAAMIVWLGGRYGTSGIFASLYLSDVARGAALWLTLIFLSRRQGQLKGRASAAG